MPWRSVYESSPAADRRLVLQRQQLRDEIVDEPLETAGEGWGGRTDHELAEPDVDIGLDPGARFCPRRREQRGRVHAGPAPLHRAHELWRHVADRDADAVVVVLDVAAG